MTKIKAKKLLALGASLGVLVRITVYAKKNAILVGKLGTSKRFSLSVEGERYIRKLASRHVTG